MEEFLSNSHQMHCVDLMVFDFIRRSYLNMFSFNLDPVALLAVLRIISGNIYDAVRWESSWRYMY